MNQEERIVQLEQEIKAIKLRNRRVEADKRWELSSARKLVVFILTYAVVLIVFLLVGVAKPFANALVPAVAFVLSTLTVGMFKRIWTRYYKE